FFGQQLVAAICGHLVEFLKPLHGLLNRYPIGEQSAQPALVHVETTTALCFFGNCVLGLALGADEQHNLAFSCQFLYELRRLFKHLQRLLQINDVNPVALSEDVFLHLGIPALGLMPEVDARFEQLLHSNVSQSTSSFSLHRSLALRPLAIAIPVPAPRSTGRIEHLQTGRQLSAFSQNPCHSEPLTVALPRRERVEEPALPLAVLEALSCAFLTVLLPFLGTRI